MPLTLVRVACLLCFASPAWPQIAHTGCPETGQVRVPTRVLAGSDFVELRRGACFGRCPDYSIRIRADGSVVWIGTRWVQTEGKATGFVVPDKAKALLEQFRTPEFWALCDCYSQGVTDRSTDETTVSIGGVVKKVSDYASSAPPFLRKLGLQIDALANTHRWRHGNPRSETFGWPPEECYLPKPGVTPLMCPTHQDVPLSVLLRSGDVNAADSSGWTPLMYAAYGTDEVFDQLLNAGANLRAASTTQQTVFMAVVRSSAWTEHKIQRLIAMGGDVNATDSAGRTALMFAVQQRWLPDIATSLIAEGARANIRVDIRDASGKSAEDYLNADYGETGNKSAEETAAYHRVRDALKTASRR